MHLTLIALCLVLASTAVFSQAPDFEYSPWESEDLKSVYQSPAEVIQYETSPFKQLAFKLIGFYQKKISSRSVSRCPFYFSCSKYAYHVIERYGFVLGVAMFIDRNLYRENIDAYKRYPWRESGGGIIKLDDTIFIYGEKFSDQQTWMPNSKY